MGATRKALCLQLVSHSCSIDQQQQGLSILSFLFDTLLPCFVTRTPYSCCIRHSPACHCRHSLETELRVLLVHGLLHLVGFDHELGEQQLQDMAAQEVSLLTQLGWEGSGLISVAAAAEDEDEDNEVVQGGNDDTSSSSWSDSTSDADSVSGSEGSVSSSSGSSRSRYVL